MTNTPEFVTKRKKGAGEALNRFTRILKTEGAPTAFRHAYQYLTNPAINPLLRHFFYRQWIHKHEPSEQELSIQRTRSQMLPAKPLISLLVPVYNPPLDVITDTLDSVTAQTYPDWECCIANGDVSNTALKSLLDDRAKADPRFKVVHLEQNLGIAGNTNAAAALATGSYAGFLDHDDMLAPFALFEVALTLWSDPEIDILYSDEDNIDSSGKRVSPFFKPGFSPDLLRSMNYMCHFLVVRRSLGEDLGWIRSGFEGAQDFDFILRATEKTNRVVRIAKILYHWRSIAGSAAADDNAKPYATVSGVKALEEHLKRLNTPGSAESHYLPTWYRIRYDLQQEPKVSIIILNHDHADDLAKLLRSIRERSSYNNYEILIVENNSSQQAIFDLYAALRGKDERVKILEFNKPFNYSRANNFAANKASGEVLLFLNNDMEIISPDWLEEMLVHAVRPAVGTVGAKLLFPNNTIQHAGVIVGIGKVASHGHKGYDRASIGYGGRLILTHNVAASTAACLMMRKEVFQQVGGFNEDYILAYGDIDLCLRVLEKKLVNVWTPFAELYHHESKTRGMEESPEQIARYQNEVFLFQKRWGKFIRKGDPYYNPNLSLEHEDFRWG